MLSLVVVVESAEVSKDDLGRACAPHRAPVRAFGGVSVGAGAGMARCVFYKYSSICHGKKVFD